MLIMKSYRIYPAVSILFQIHKVFPKFNYNNVREDNNIRTINNIPNVEYHVVIYRYYRQDYNNNLLDKYQKLSKYFEEKIPFHI